MVGLTITTKNHPSGFDVDRSTVDEYRQTMNLEMAFLGRLPYMFKFTLLRDHWYLSLTEYCSLPRGPPSKADKAQGCRQ